MRQDANRSREAILAAAREILGSFGELKLSLVAQRAGVGQATLYRHFPTQDALLGAVYEAEIDELVAAASSFVESAPPVEALRLWFGRLAEYVRVKRGVMAVVEASVWGDISSSTMGKLGAALSTLLDAAPAGTFRDGIDPRDVILLSWSLAHVAPDEWEERVPRLVEVWVSGLRATVPVPAAAPAGS